MLVGIFKEKVNNSEHYIYMDEINGKISYHGVTLCNKNAYPLGEDVLIHIYNAFKINDDCKHIKDYKGYKVYYDDKNNLTHYIKDGKEDFLMFLLKNGKSADLYKDKFFSSICKHKLLYVVLLTETATFLGAVSLICVLLASMPHIDSKINTDFRTNVEYFQDKLVGNELDSVTADKAIEMINSSTRLTESDKEFLCNYELLNDVLPYYENTNMEYVIKARLDDFGIVYEELDDMLGRYCYSNEIYLAESLEDASDATKQEVESHEFVHALQADSLLYIKESSAEVISSEYFENDITAYSEACYNFRLLVETLGPKVMWNYIFSGNDTEFTDLLKNNLSNNDYNCLKEELSKSPFYDNPNHNLINELIHRLYKNIYNDDILNNHDIYDFNGKYIEKKCFKSDDSSSKVIYCDIDKAFARGLVEYAPLYKFTKKISSNDVYNFINYNNSTNCFIDNTYSYGIEVKRNNENISCDFIDKKIVISDNEIECYDFNMESLDKLVGNYDFYFYVKNINKDYNKNDKDLELVEATQTIKSKDNNYQCIGDQLVYYTKNIRDRFPNQIIRQEDYLQSKLNII